MRAHVLPLNMPKLLAIFIAVAVLFSPALTHAGAAMAAVPGHDMQMMQGGHCDTPPSHDGKVDKSAGMSCCIATSLAVAMRVPEPVEEIAERAAPPKSRLPALHRPHFGELATPPPRSI